MKKALIIAAIGGAVAIVLKVGFDYGALGNPIT